MTTLRTFEMNKFQMSVDELRAIYEELTGEVPKSHIKWYLRKRIAHILRHGVPKGARVQLTDPDLQAEMRKVWSKKFSSYQEFLRVAVAQKLSKLGAVELAQRVKG